MNEIYKPIIDGDKPKKRESWSPALDEYKKEMARIAKIEDQIARIEGNIEDKKTKGITKGIKEMEENIAYRQKDIQETQVRADLERTKHDLSIRKLENCDPKRAGNA